MQTPIVVLDHASGREQLRFSQPASAIRADRREQVTPALAAIDAALDAGHHLAGYFSYELGYLLEPSLTPFLPPTRRVPLLWLGIFGPPEKTGIESNIGENSKSTARTSPLAHEWTQEDYASRFRRVQTAICDGDIYQANLSFRSRFRLTGDPMALYAQLRERAAAPHCAYVDDGERQILSLSPELFFRVSGDGRIESRPMKGTAARGTSVASDAAARAYLRTSPKERAENLMIVDLVRNDIGRIAEIGSIAVENLFEVETYSTIHQMVSTVAGKLEAKVRASDILRALFPCGSVTGAPKIRAMHILSELESSPRGVYCGAVGYCAPDGSASFNVAIRTLTVHGEEAELGIGGGVVHDSRCSSEYDECLLKARFLGTDQSS